VPKPCKETPPNGLGAGERRQPRQVDPLTLFIPGALVNPQASGARGHWSKHARAAKRQRERAGMYLLEARQRCGWTADPSVPKLVTFRLFAHNAYDDDNIRTATKNYRDALRDLAVVDDDRPSAGHTWIYRQEISRGPHARRGVEITVELA
jgi:hypothetical protein